VATLCVVVGVDEGTDLRGGIGLVDEATVLVQWYKGSVPPVLLDWCPKLAGKMSLLAPARRGYTTLVEPDFSLRVAI